MPKFTVIITTHGRFNELKQAINSILIQDYEDYEIILVDDNPPDSHYRNLVGQWVNQYENKINYIKNSKNLGANRSRNKGLDAAKGDYIAFLDDDDQWYSNKLTIIDKLIRQNKDALLIYSDYDVFGEDMIKKLFRRRLEKYHESLIFNLLKQNYIGPTSSVVIKATSKHRFLPDLKAWQDYHFYLQFALNGDKMAYVNSSLLKYRKHHQSISNRYKISTILDYIYDLKKEIVAKYDYKIDLEKYRQIDIARFYFYQKRPIYFLRALFKIVLSGGGLELIMKKIESDG